jgi:hypothetical protein
VVVNISCGGFHSEKGFEVRSFYCSLVCSEGYLFPRKSVWQTKDPLRAAFFAWLADLCKILTVDTLMVYSGAPYAFNKICLLLIKKKTLGCDMSLWWTRCCMLKRDVESMDHILLYFDVPYAI